MGNITTAQYLEMQRRVDAAIHAHFKPGGEDEEQKKPASTVARESARVRQSSKPLLNKLESEWWEILKVQFPNFPRPKPQAKRYKLANGVWYCPDFTATSWPQENGPHCETAWEVKGPHAWDDSIVKLKVAAHEWNEVAWILAWKDNGAWKTQRILC